jgi:hypothetical protein
MLERFGKTVTGGYAGHADSARLKRLAVRQVPFPDNLERQACRESAG